MDVKNVKLKIIKRVYANSGFDIDFALYDADGFVCVLPRFDSTHSKIKFYQFFGEKSYEIADRMLRDALQSETDTDLIKEIECRLKQFKRKPLVQCLSCPTFFIPRSTQQKRCKACRDRVRAQYERKHSPELKEYVVRHMVKEAKKLRLIPK